MEKTLKEKWAEKASEILGEKTVGYVFRLKGSQRLMLKGPHYPTAKTILAIIDAYEEAQRIVTKEEALELTLKFAHELPGVVSWDDYVASRK